VSAPAESLLGREQAESAALFAPALLGASQQERRVLAVVLPELMVELVEQAQSFLPARAQGSGRMKPCKPQALGVVLVEGQGSASGLVADASVKSTAKLEAVNAAARRLGLRVGQSIAEASAEVAVLQVYQLPRERVARALATLAELFLDLGPLVAVGAPDTVWVDITGAAHLMGGEAELLEEAVARVSALGHSSQAAIANGPVLARAFACWAVKPRARAKNELKGRGIVIPAGKVREEVGQLPLAGLPMGEAELGFFARMGLFSVGDVQKLPKSAVSLRLGEQASKLLLWCEGLDEEPLTAYKPARVVQESASFAEPVATVEPLFFVLRGLVAKVSARLAARGEAAEELVLVLAHELRQAQFQGQPGKVELGVSLPSPMWREEDLGRVLKSKLTRRKPGCAVCGLSLKVRKVVPALGRQLTLAGIVQESNAVQAGELAVLVGELAADIGQENVGILQVLDAHRPEAQSALSPAVLSAGSQRRKGPRARPRPGMARRQRPEPTRLFARPLLLQERAFRAGETLGIGRQLYTIEKVAFEQRLEGVEWWSAPVSRDYVRLCLRGHKDTVLALGYVNRDTGSHYLQAIFD
jgi:protein ImuB